MAQVSTNQPVGGGPTDSTLFNRNFAGNNTGYSLAGMDHSQKNITSNQMQQFAATAGSGFAPNTRAIFSQEGRNRDAKLYGVDPSYTGAGQLRSSTRGTENLFSESIVEQAQMKKPAFNTGTFRPPNEATKDGFVRFNPGPGSYSTRINSMGSQFLDTKGADRIFKGFISQQGAQEKNVYYTRANGGLKQHNQPLSLGRTVREGVEINLEAVKNQGPGKYDPVLPQDMQKVVPARTVKSQGNARGKTSGFQAKNNFFQKKLMEAQQDNKMEMRVRKQPKWHQLVSSVPSIPPKDKQVPEGDDYDADIHQSKTSPSSLKRQAEARLRQQQQQLKKQENQNLLTAGEATLTGGMQVVPDQDLYPTQMLSHNTDLVTGQHQVVRISGGNRQTATTIFENQSQHPFANDHHISSATINDQQQMLNNAAQQRQGNVSSQKAPFGHLLGGLDDPNNVMTAENSILREPMNQIYATNHSMMQANKDAARLEMEPTRGVEDHGTHKRPRNKITTANMSDRRGLVSGAEDYEDDEYVAEIGTHRKESAHDSHNELTTTVHKFNSNMKNQSINQSQENMLDQRMSPVHNIGVGQHALMDQSQQQHKSDLNLSPGHAQRAQARQADGDFSNSSLKAVPRGFPIHSQAQIAGEASELARIAGPGGVSPYFDADQFGHQKPLQQQQIAAEIKVSRTNKTRQKSSDNRQGSSSGQQGALSNTQKAGSTGKQNHPQSHSRSPSRPKYDTREEDGTNLNVNQKKSYNKKFEFFTKPLGPGHYDPNLEVVKPKKQGTAWGATRSSQRQGPEIGRQQIGQPGPGQYSYQNDTIQMTQIRNVMQAEGAFDKERGELHFKKLSKKVTVRPSNQMQKEKQEMHMKRKDHFGALRGPGTYPVQMKNTSFNIAAKKEQHQCFNSTSNRFPNEVGTNNTKMNPVVGPGSYDLVKDVFNRSLSQNRANTAAFLTKRPQDIFGIKDLPGPQEYNPGSSQMMSRGKSWTTTAQAFGTTEKRFAGQSVHVPGPGTYKSERHNRMAAKFAVQRVSGQLVKVKKGNTQSASFKSRTGRQIQTELTHAEKLNYPGMGAYRANDWDTIAQQKIEGGAPNNFLLMKNDRQRAPFNSTVHRFTEAAKQ